MTEDWIKEFYIKRIKIESFIKKYIDVERILGYCKACPRYAKSWSCPSFDFNPLDFWKKYNFLYLVAQKVEIPYEFRKTEKGKAFEASDKIYTKIKQNLTITLLKEKRLGEMVLSGGHCNFCKECKRNVGEPCHKPELLTYSIESLGGDVVKITEELLEKKILWGDDNSLPPYYITVGGILSNDENRNITFREGIKNA